MGEKKCPPHYACKETERMRSNKKGLKAKQSQLYIYVLQKNKSSSYFLRNHRTAYMSCSLSWPALVDVCEESEQGM